MGTQPTRATAGSEGPSSSERRAMDRLQYLLLMAACVLVTLPLELGFGVRVWRSPRRLGLALLPAFALFVVWDLWATRTGTWGFSPDYTIGLPLPGGMAVEELVFFTVIPVCGLLTLETVRRHPRDAGDVVLMPIYPTLAVAAAVAVVLVEIARAPHRSVSRPGVLDLDGDLLRLHDPGGRLAHEAARRRSCSIAPRTPAASHPIWDIPLEEYAYAFALLTAVMLTWDHLGRRTRGRDRGRRRSRHDARSCCSSAPFVAMEGVSYAAHRWVMHGRGMGWHRSHHAPPAARFERNDRFPLVLLRGRLPALPARLPGRRTAVVGRRRCHRLRRRVPLRPRGVHPPSAAVAATPPRDTSSGSGTSHRRPPRRRRRALRHAAAARPAAVHPRARHRTLSTAAFRPSPDARPCSPSEPAGLGGQGAVVHEDGCSAGSR